MKRLLIAILLTPIFSFAQTDYQCVNDCTGKGYQYQFCTSKCSFNEQTQLYQQTPQIQPIKQTDYACVNDCTKKGYQYQFCTSRCSY